MYSKNCEKLCKKCGITQDIKEFERPFVRSKRGGSSKFCNTCFFKRSKINIKDVYKIINNTPEENSYRYCSECKETKELNFDNFVLSRISEYGESNGKICFKKICMECFFKQVEEQQDKKLEKQGGRKRGRLKKCSECDRYLERNKFKQYENKNGKRIGEICYSDICLECMEKPAEERKYYINKEKIVENYRICIDCGTIEKLNSKNFPISSYTYDTISNPEGEIYFRHRCHSCYKKYIKTVKLTLKQINFKIIAWATRSIYKSLKYERDNNEIFLILGYTYQQLRNHIENCFKQQGNEWMSWENWGKYEKNLWNDNDNSTWYWHMDHIIPHSEFKYNDVEDQKFKDCWALSNLRPYNAKQNIIDGSTKIRHKKKINNK